MEKMRRARHALLAGIAGAAPLVSVSAVAAQVTLYWDGDGVGPVGGGTGTWDTTLTRWSLTPDGSVFQAWVNANNDDAVFANAPGTVTVPAAGVTARSLEFQIGGYTLSGAGPLTMAGSSVGTINVAGGVTTMGVPIAGVDGFTKMGAGTLVLTASTTATGNRRILGGAVNIDTTLRIPNNGTVTLDGGMLVETNPTSGGSYISAGVALDIGAGGGTVSYTGGAGSSSIYAGTIRGPGILHKVGTGEFRYQGTGLPNTTYSKLVVHEGLFRLGFVSPTQDERGFGAVPAAFTADAITLDGGAIGTSFNTTLHANRGVTLGPGGGTYNSATGAATLQASITGVGGLSKTGLQIVTFTGISDFTGPFTLLDNRVNVHANNALGLGNLVFAVTGNGTLANNGPVDVTLNNPLVNLQSGSIDISATSGRTLTFTGKLTGPANWKKDNSAATGSLVLSNDTSDFTGGLNVLAGRLVITANNALGSAAGATTVNSGATLVMRGGFDYGTAEPLTVGGSGPSPGNLGAIHNASDNNRFAGPITLTAATAVGVAAGSLELAGPISGSFTLQKLGSGTLVLGGSGNTFTQLTIDAGAVSVGSDGNLGAAPGTPTASRIVIADNAGLHAASSFTINPNRGINLPGTTGAINVSPGVTLTYDGVAVGQTLNKTGGGSLVLGGVNAHTGGTVIHAGTLSLSPTGVLPGDVSIAAGAALHGRGSVGGNVTVNGTISPGASPGTFATTGNHTWQGGGTYAWEIDDAAGAPGSNWDHVTMNAVTISATAGNKFTIRIVALPGNGGPGLDNFDPDAPASWVIATATSGTVNNFDLEAFAIDASQFEQDNENKGGFYVSRSGGDLMLNYVPEPGTASLLMLTVSSALLRRRRRH
jgi:autotransporter-associated beta strand protein